MSYLYDSLRTSKCLRLVSLIFLLGLATACTRKPYDPSFSETRNEDYFTFVPVLESATIWQVAASSAPDGKIAVAAATAYREVVLLESSAGTWNTTKTLSGGGLHPSSLSLAPGPSGAWWILASDTEVGMKLFRVGGIAADTSLVIPMYNNVPWDSTRYGALASDSQGRPVAVLNAGGAGLVRAALTDTGWVLSHVPLTGTYSAVDDFAIGPLDQEHLVYHGSAGNAGMYQLISSDTTITNEISESGDNLAITVTSDGIPVVAGSVGYQSSLLIWELLSGETGPYWEAEVLSFVEEDLYEGRYDICLNSADTPYLAFATWQGAARFTVNMAKREAGIVYGWVIVPVASDLARVGGMERIKAFRVVMDALDTPHFFFLSGESGSTISTLWEAIPIP